MSSKDASWAAGGTTKTKGIDLGTSDWISLALTGENIANGGQAFTVEIVFRTGEIPAGDQTLFQCSANGDTKREDGIFLMLKDSGEKMQYTIYSGTGRFVFHNALRLSPPLASRHFPSPPVPSPRVTPISLATRSHHSTARNLSQGSSQRVCSSRLCDTISSRRV